MDNLKEIIDQLCELAQGQYNHSLSGNTRPKEIKLVIKECPYYSFEISTKSLIISCRIMVGIDVIIRSDYIIRESSPMLIDKAKNICLKNILRDISCDGILGLRQRMAKSNAVDCKGERLIKDL